jgi:hypothetical protein
VSFDYDPPRATSNARRFLLAELPLRRRKLLERPPQSDRDPLSAASLRERESFRSFCVDFADASNAAMSAASRDCVSGALHPRPIVSVRAPPDSLTVIINNFRPHRLCIFRTRGRTGGSGPSWRPRQAQPGEAESLNVLDDFAESGCYTDDFPVGRLLLPSDDQHQSLMKYVLPFSQKLSIFGENPCREPILARWSPFPSSRDID